MKPYHTWVVGGFLLSALICWSQFSSGNPLVIIGIVLPQVGWLVIPFLVAGFIFRMVSKPSSDVFTKEIPMEPSEKLFVEFTQSPEKAKFGPPCDKVRCMEVYNFRKTGDIGYKLEMDGEDWVLLLDGRVNPPNGNRAYTLMPWRKLHQNGFNSLYDMEKKLSKASTDTISQLLSEMEPDEVSEILKATGGRLGGGEVRGVRT